MSGLMMGVHLLLQQGQLADLGFGHVVDHLAVDMRSRQAGGSNR
jgi:hypothetical protein